MPKKFDLLIFNKFEIPVPVKLLTQNSGSGKLIYMNFRLRYRLKYQSEFCFGEVFDSGRSQLTTTLAPFEFAPLNRGVKYLIVGQTFICCFHFRRSTLNTIYQLYIILFCGLEFTCWLIKHSDER